MGQRRPAIVGQLAAAQAEALARLTAPRALLCATRAKLFQNGGSQAVRLPKACGFTAQREVLVRREGRRVILEPADEWSSEFRSCLGSVSGDIPRLKQPKLTHARNVFD